MAFARILQENHSNNSDYFDSVIGHIEDIVIEEQFQTMLHNFMEENWKEFESSDENKIIYMEIFNNYTNCIENYIVDELKKRIENFCMEQFSNQLQ